MSEREFITHSSEETIARGKELAAQMKPPLLVLLSGELGAGKTTFAKGIISGLGSAREEEVTSPTFTLVHVFSGSVKIYHVDLYRIADAQDFHTLGLEDLFDEPAIVLVEWPERLRLRADWPILRIRLEHSGDADTRKITLEEIAAQAAPGKVGRAD
jgi:tRNA threonylcarbamoyladenosine biosynthesis protein TsaE